MAITQANIVEIEIQKQTMENPGSNYLILIKSESDRNKLLKIITTNKEPIIRFTQDNGSIVTEQKN